MISRSAKQNIVIIGGGFGGLRAALDLEKHLSRNASLAQQYHIVVIDKDNRHVFVPALYEIATTLQDDAHAYRLQQAVAVPYETLFADKKHITFVQDAVTDINVQMREVCLKDSKNIFFSSAVVAVGSQPRFYNIPGLKDKAYTLASIEDAVRLRNRLAEVFAKAEKDNKKLRIVVGGGGVTGVELAGELTGYLENLAKKTVPPPAWKMTIVQGNKEILPELRKNVRTKTQEMLKQAGVHIQTNERIAAVRNQTAYTESRDDTGKSYTFDILLWAGGIKPANLVQKLPFKKDERGRVSVNKTFNPYHKNGKAISSSVFIVGDACCFMADGKPLPATAWSAIHQGKHIARAIKARMWGNPLPSYQPLPGRFVVPVKGKRAIAQIGPLVTSGFHIWMLKELIYLRYLLQILPFWHAIPKWLKATWLFMKND